MRVKVGDCTSRGSIPNPSPIPWASTVLPLPSSPERRRIPSGASSRAKARPSSRVSASLRVTMGVIGRLLVLALQHLEGPWENAHQIVRGQVSHPQPVGGEIAGQTVEVDGEERGVQDVESLGDEAGEKA